jgi:hypothetical protein
MMTSGQARSGRRALLVVGMHRSGTSAVTRVLGYLGAGLPATLLPPSEFNEPGYWESSVLMALHDELLASCNSAWDDFSALEDDWYGTETESDFRRRFIEALESEFGEEDLFVLKDPRIVRFIPFWQRLLKEIEVKPLFVVPYRDPFAVAASLENRGTLAVSHALLLWLRHVVEAEVGTRGQRRTIVSYDRLLDDWREQAETAARDLGLDWPTSIDEAAPEIETFLSERYRHHGSRPTATSTRGPGDLFALVELAFGMLERGEVGVEWETGWAELFQGLEALSSSVEMPMPNTEVLVRLRQEGDGLQAETGRLAGSLAETEEEARRLAEDNAGLNQAIEGLRTDIEGAQSELAGVRGELAQSQTDLEELRAQFSETRSSLATTEADLHSVLTSKSWKLTRPLRALVALLKGS